jgi:hemerythrin
LFSESFAVENRREPRMPVTEGWSPSLSIGIAEIDEQHRAVFGAIDGLRMALRHGYGDQEVMLTLDIETHDRKLAAFLKGKAS